MIHPTHPRILRDRDNYRRWYLDEPTTIHLKDGHRINLPKGYRFDGHSVPLIFRLVFRRYNNRDVYAAMVHDALVDFASLHRFNRRYIDQVYKDFMRKPEYISTKLRATWMPRAVSVWGFLAFTLWGDYRGEPKPNTVIDITMV